MWIIDRVVLMMIMVMTMMMMMMLVWMGWDRIG